MKTIYKLLTILSLMFMANSLYSQYSLWTWGRNNFGQVGNDLEEDEPLPIIVNEDGDWEKIYPYYAIKKDGSLWTWGNVYGNRVNDGEETSIRLFDNSKWKDIYTTYSTVYGIKEDGSLWSWGSWNKGWIITENAEKTEETILIKTPFLVDRTHKWVHFVSNGYFNLAIDQEGKLYNWGRYIPFMNNGNPDQEDLDSIMQIGLDSNWKEIHINQGYSQTYGIKDDGSLWFWGYDGLNIFGEQHKLYSIATKVEDYKCIDFFNNHHGIVLLDSNGTLQSIGRYFDLDNKLKLNFKFKNFKFSSRNSSVFSLFKGDSIFLWGRNKGLNFTSKKQEGDYYSPNFLDIKENVSIPEGIIDLVQVREGFVLIDSSNNLRAWGSNSYGDLANGKSSFYNEPINILPNKYFKDISSGNNYNLAIDDYGMMWGWGNNEELGLKNMNEVNKPVPINYDHDWKEVFSYKYSNFAIKTDGSLWAWGANPNGILGLGHNEPVYQPTKIEEKGVWVQVFSSESYSSNNHTLGLKEDGSLWVWGAGGIAMGIKDVTQSYIPIRIGSDNDWVQVACGINFSIALKKDGTIWGWGKNEGGVLGDYFTKQYELPTKLTNNVGDVIKLCASSESVHFFLKGGKYKLWNFWACGNVQGEYNGLRSMSISQNQNSSFIDLSGVLYLWDESENFVGPSAESGFVPNDWIKVTGGKEHYLGLRGDYITNVREPQKLVNADVYPNPSVSKINIDFEKFYNNVSISIYDVYGKLVLEDDSYNTDRISVNHNLPHGTYILQCRDDNNLIVDQVLVVE